MDKDPIEVYNQANTTLDTAFAHQNTSPNMATIIYDIMAKKHKQNGNTINTPCITRNHQTDKTQQLTHDIRLPVTNASQKFLPPV